MKVYLSGGIEYATNFGKDWREEISCWLKKSLSHSIFNPTKESISFFKEHFPDFKRPELKKMSVHEIREIIGKLINFEISTIISETDYVICYWDESCYKGAGTQGELTVAKFNKIPIYLVTTIEIADIPSWIIGCSTDIFDSFEELKVHLCKIYQ